MSEAELISPDVPVAFVVTAVYDHVVSVKVWYRTPDTDWQLVADTGTGAGDSVQVIVPPAHEPPLPLPRNSQIYYALAISNHSLPNRPYSVTIGLKQDGQALAVTQDNVLQDDGLIKHAGALDGSGAAAKQAWVDLL